MFHKFSPDLFLEVAELNRFKQSLDDKGFRKNILENSVSFGLIKNKYIDPTFLNGKVERDLDTVGGVKTIKIRELKGIDKNGNFLYSALQNGINVPDTGIWYWVKAAYAASNVELGSFTLSPNGDLVDTSGTAELTKIFRGMPNFPTRIKFANSLNNTGEYDVLDVIDDTHATLQSLVTVGGQSLFAAETNLKIKIVGTFTPGITVPSGSKFPFNYDSLTTTLVQELFTNTPPAITADVEFFLARIKVSGSTVVIQDKRTAYWQTKADNLPLEIERTANPLIGIESVQYNNFYTPCDKNIVSVGWGMRSSNWTIDSSNNIVTFSSGNGGKFKSVNDFTNGQLNGYRLYTPNGNYRKILSSVKQGSAINFSLDVLDVNDYSTDGGTTFIAGTLIAVPDCEKVEILFTPNPADNKAAFKESFVFPVNTLVGRCDVLVYDNPVVNNVSLGVQYNVQYRYITNKDYTSYSVIPTDTAAGYLTEASFDSNGNLKAPVDRVLYPYTNHATNGFIKLNLDPNSIRNFKSKVDKGDLIGVERVTNLSTSSQYNLVVGSSSNYQYISGGITLANDIVFSVNTIGSVEGNEFRIHFNASSFNLGGKNILIYQNFQTASQVLLKSIGIGDMYTMQNQDGGIVLTLKFKGDNWVISQNYNLGVPEEIIQVSGTIAAKFDNSGLGKVRGLFGYAIMDGNNGTVDIRKRFIAVADPSTPGYHEGDFGGAPAGKVTLDITNIPSHNHPSGTLPGKGSINTITSGVNKEVDWQNGLNEGRAFTADEWTAKVGGDPANGNATKPIEINPPYYAVIFCKKLF